MPLEHGKCPRWKQHFLYWLQILAAMQFDHGATKFIEKLNWQLLFLAKPMLWLALVICSVSQNFGETIFNNHLKWIEFIDKLCSPIHFRTGKRFWLKASLEGHNCVHLVWEIAFIESYQLTGSHFMDTTMRMTNSKLSWTRAPLWEILGLSSQI